MAGVVGEVTVARAASIVVTSRMSVSCVRVDVTLIVVRPGHKAASINRHC